MFSRTVFLAALLTLAPIAHGEDAPLGKIIAVYPAQNSTTVILETKDPLVPGKPVYLGPDRLAVTVGKQLSRSGPKYYYDASGPGQLSVANGDAVGAVPPMKDATPAPSTATAQTQEHYAFEPKHRGEVTSVQGSIAMIDRGSLHEAHELDIYRVYDPSGRYKGMLELNGIGERQSSGKLYNTLEDFHRGARKIAPGDRAVFAGQRQHYGFGAEGGIMARRELVGSEHEDNYGGGLLWSVTFQGGWSAEILFGGYGRTGHARMSFASGSGINELTRRALFIAPTWVKKNFFSPSVVSPFLAAGASVFTGYNKWMTIGVNGADEARSATTLVPVLGAGVEFFPSRLFQPRLEIRYFGGPTLTARGNGYNTESVFYSFGFLRTW